MALAGQVCKNSLKQSNLYPNYCAVVSGYQNASSHSGDVHIDFESDRYEDSALGWVAFAPGAYMKGSLMFIIYGDPAGDAPPTLSVRTANAHAPPFEITPSGLDIRVETEWVTVSGNHKRAKAGIDCYGCTAWTGTDISVTREEFPYIWAYNHLQDFAGSFETDVELLVHSSMGQDTFNMHARESGDRTVPESKIYGNEAGSTGNFALDRRLWLLHGVLAASAFLIVFPLGALAIRSRTSTAFRMHWILQIVASAFAFWGIALGFIMSGKVSAAHQYLGLSLGVIMLVQVLLGYRHHVVFKRIKKSTWMSKTHVLLGGGFMVAGIVNVVLGLRLANYHKNTSIAVAVLGAVEAVGICYNRWRWSKRKQNSMDLKRQGCDMAELERHSGASADDSAFLIADEEEDDDADLEAKEQE